MRNLCVEGVAGLALLALASIPANAAIRGDYVEVRSADVYTGPCFANAEVALEGNEAILAWKVRQGAWQGVNLDGLSVVAVVKAKATLGDPTENPYPTRAVVIVDQRATDRQQNALKEFAQAMGGKLLANIVRVERAAIRLQAGERGDRESVRLVAGDLARIETRGLCAHDHLCGNEFVYYPPLTKVANAVPAYTLNDTFSGDGLGVVWSHVDKRSAFVGSFAF